MELFHVSLNFELNFCQNQILPKFYVSGSKLLLFSCHFLLKSFIFERSGLFVCFFNSTFLYNFYWFAYSCGHVEYCDSWAVQAAHLYYSLYLLLVFFLPICCSFPPACCFTNNARPMLCCESTATDLQTVWTRWIAAFHEVTLTWRYRETIHTSKQKSKKKT